jgi:hypothetical protein
MVHEYLNLLFQTHCHWNSMTMKVINLNTKPPSGLKNCGVSIPYFKDYFIKITQYSIPLLLIERHF